MGEKFFAGLVAAAVIAPLCAVCILGPAVLTSIFTGIAAWLGGFDLVGTAVLGLVAGIAVYGIIRWRRVQRSPMTTRIEVSDKR